jgi:hypothetical protein
MKSNLRADEEQLLITIYTGGHYWKLIFISYWIYFPAWGRILLNFNEALCFCSTSILNESRKRLITQANLPCLQELFIQKELIFQAYFIGQEKYQVYKYQGGVQLDLCVWHFTTFLPDSIINAIIIGLNRENN